jgi:hypothetical protein
MPFLLDQLWIVHDGRVGHRNQAQALGNALGGADRELRLAPRGLARWLAPRRTGSPAAAFGKDFAAMLARPPRLAIGCGRSAALATRYLREAGSKVVQILDPRIDPSLWDAIVAPDHDRVRGDNVLGTCGSLHGIDERALSRARARWSELAELPRPITTVLLGGPTRHARFDHSAFEVLMTHLERWLHAEGGSVLLSASPRTPAKIAVPARHRLDGTPGRTWIDAGDGDNPYLGFLTHADRIIVSPDSVNMVSEACATLVPVFVAEPGRARGRVGEFLRTLLERGRIRALGPRSEEWKAEPLRECARIAEALRARGFGATT